MKKLDELIELAKNEPIAEVPFSDEELLTMLEGPAQSATGSTSLFSKFSKGALIMVSGIISLMALLLLTNPQQNDTPPKVQEKETLNPGSSRKGAYSNDDKQYIESKRTLDAKHTKAKEQLSPDGPIGTANSDNQNSGSQKQTIARLGDVNSGAQPNAKSNSGTASASATAQLTVTKSINGISALELTDEELKALDIFQAGDTYKFPMDVLPRKAKFAPNLTKLQVEQLQNKLSNLSNIKVNVTTSDSVKATASVVTESNPNANPSAIPNMSFKFNMDNGNNNSEGDDISMTIDSSGKTVITTNSVSIKVNRPTNTPIEDGDVFFMIPNIDSLVNSFGYNMKDEDYKLLDSLGMTKEQLIDSVMKTLRKNLKIEANPNAVNLRLGNPKNFPIDIENEDAVDMRRMIYDDVTPIGMAWREINEITPKRINLYQGTDSDKRTFIDVNKSCAPFMVSTVAIESKPNGDPKRKTFSYLNCNSPSISEASELPNEDVTEFLSKSGIKIIPIRIKLSDRSSNSIDADLWYVVDKKFVEKLPERYREPLMKEMEIADMVGEGALAPQEACSRLEGEKSYLDICRAGSANIKDVKAYPQPVSSGDLNIEFDLAANETVRAELYSVDGIYIATLAQPTAMTAGKQKMLTPIRGVENGVYLLALKTELGEEVVTKIIVNK